MGLCCGGKKQEIKDYGKGVAPLDNKKLPGKVTTNKDKPAEAKKESKNLEVWGDGHDAQALTVLNFLDAIKFKYKFTDFNSD